MKHKALLISVFFNLSLLLYSQSIKGKWLLIRGINSMATPNIPVIGFKDSIRINYDFNRPIDSIRFTIKDGNIFYDSEKTTSLFKFTDKEKNSLKITSKGVVDLNFLRITNTRCSLSWLEAKKIVSFLEIQINENKEILLKKVISRVDKNIVLELEKLEKMFFLSIYRNDIRTYVFPIKVFSGNQIMIYNPHFNKYQIIKI